MIEGHLNRAIGRRIMERKIVGFRNHCVICCFCRVGSRVAEEFATARKPFVVIDENEVNVQNCIQKGYLALQGDAASDDVVREAGIQHAQALLVATDEDANNIFITLSARNLNPNLLIVSRANHDETIVKLKRAGANRVLSPYTIAGRRMANLALQPAVVDFFDTLMNAEIPELAVREVTLPANSALIGKTIADAQNMMTDGTMILAIKKPDGLVIGSRLEGVFAKISGKGKLTEADVDEAVREVRLALLEADVSLKLVRQFVERVKAKAVGADVLGSFSPAQQVLQIVNDELVEMLGRSEGNVKLDLGGPPPNVIMLVGLQGSGKTTTTAKLANYLRN